MNVSPQIEARNLLMDSLSSPSTARASCVSHDPMASVEVLLSSLYDPQRAIASPDVCRSTLLDLVTVCRFDRARYELINRDGLDVLARLAAAMEMHTSLPDVAESLLKLLMLLACDRHHSARAKVADKPPLLAFPLVSLRVFVAQKPGKKRNVDMRIALELLEQLSFTEPSRRAPFQDQLISTLLRVLENPDDDHGMLQYVADMLTGTMEAQCTSIRTAAKFNAIPTLLRLLSTSSEHAELRRSACAALLIIASVSELVPIVVANGAIHAIAECLRLRNVNRGVEGAVLRLLLRLCDESQVYGQLIKEELIPIIFQTLERSANSADVTRSSCRILEGVANFARSCKLDLSPFFQGGRMLNCHGCAVVQSIAMYSQEYALVASCFRFFGHVVRNPVELPFMIDSDVIEGLLALYIVHCGTSLGSAAAALSDQLVIILTQLSRPAIERIWLHHEDQSLPALFLCLRSHIKDASFTRVVFTIMARHWSLKNATTRCAHAISGFIGIAIELLLQQNGAFGDEEVLGFLREVLLTPDGGEVALTCGGIVLNRILIQSLPRSPEADNDLTKVARTVSDMLARAISAAVNKSTSAERRELHSDESSYVSLQRSSSGQSLRSGVNEPVGDPFYLPSSILPHKCDDPGGIAFDNDEKDEDEADDCANDDGSDSSDEEESMPEAKTCEVLTRLRIEEIVPSTDSGETERLSGGMTAVSSLSPRHIRVVSPELQPVDFSKLIEQSYCFVDTSGTQYPKHPCRSTPDRTDDGSLSRKADPFLLAHDPPTQPELCRPPDSTSMAAFIEQAIRRRQEFLALDVQSRSRLVYENLAVYSHKRGEDVSCSTPETPTICAFMPYEISEKSSAFSSVPSLTFDSWFESGNLERSIQVGEFEYDLVLRRDLNTMGHTQWFYFAVSNTSPGTKYRFNIVNLCKPDSLFNQGLQPVVYSARDAGTKRIGWRRAGEDIYYFPNPIPRGPNSTSVTPGGIKGAVEGSEGPEAAMGTSSQHRKKAAFFSLTFTLEFPNAEDTYLIAHSYPYTFSDHQRHLQHVLHRLCSSKRRAPQVVKHTVLCTTVSDRPCDLLTITDFSVSAQELKSRRAVMLTARVHPGEAQSSWIMRGVIDFLLSGCEMARVLRRLFVFRVVPMLNPDGVFFGNSRCSLSACDLNRHWHDPCPQRHPTIYHTKELLRNDFATRGIVFYCDIHGHSRKKNVFMYGCDTKKRPNPRARVFAKLLSTQATAKRFISFPDCSFKVSKDKETTARVVLTKELRLALCFTLEASFCGASFGDLQGTHFNTSHLHQVGSALCETLLPTCITDIPLRDRLVALVDNYSVSLTSYADRHMREAGIVSEASTTTASDPQPPPVQTPRREKSKKEGTKTRRRRRSVPQQDDDKKDKQTNDGSLTGSKSVMRKLSSKRAALTTGALPRRKSSPLSPESDAVTAEINRLSERRRPSGTTTAPKSLRASRRTLSMPSKTSDGDKSTPKRSQHQPLLDLLGTFEPPDEEDTQLYKLQSIVQGSSSSTTSSTSQTSTQPAIPETLQHPPLSVPPRRMTMPPAIHCEDSSTLASLVSYGVRDTAPFVLPPPVSDVTLSRSPKPPSTSVRFKGAGRQYSAVSPSAKTTSISELMKTGSLASAVGYEPDLINASSIPLKQRAPTAVTTDSVGSRTLKLPTATLASSKGGSRSPYMGRFSFC